MGSKNSTAAPLGQKHGPHKHATTNDNAWPSGHKLASPVNINMRSYAPVEVTHISSQRDDIGLTKVFPWQEEEKRWESYNAEAHGVVQLWLFINWSAEVVLRKLTQTEGVSSSVNVSLRLHCVTIFRWHPAERTHEIDLACLKRLRRILEKDW